jgi:hypothetical protein
MANLENPTARDKPTLPRLSEVDIEAIVDALEERMVNRLRYNVGQGVLSLLWKTAIVAIMALASYGSIKGIMR